MLSLLTDLARSARRPAIARRCAAIALVVGTLLSLVNQGDALVAGRLTTATVLRVLANYAIPFVVANLGAMSSLPSRLSARPPQESPAARPHSGLPRRK